MWLLSARATEDMEMMLERNAVAGGGSMLAMFCSHSNR